MTNSSSNVTNNLNPGSSASLKNDQRMVTNEFSSKRQKEYIIQKNEYYSLSEKPFEEVQKEMNIKVSENYIPLEKIVVVKLR